MRVLLQIVLLMLALPLIVHGFHTVTCFKFTGDQEPDIPTAPEGCAAILCPQGTTCVADVKQCFTQPCPQVKCVPIVNDGRQCRRTGCSREICSDTDKTSTCIYRPENACLDLARCEKDPV